jgi:hypothetical protein
MPEQAPTRPPLPTVTEAEAKDVLGKVPEWERWYAEPLLKSEAGRRLIVLNPALAVAAGLHAGCGLDAAERLQDLLELPPRLLAERLGFGASRASLRVLSLLEPESIEQETLEELAHLLTHRPAKWLFHLEKLNDAVVQTLVVAKRRRLVTFAFLEDIGSGLDDVTQMMVVDALDEVAELRADLPGVDGRRFASFDELMDEGYMLASRAEARQLVLPLPLPAPPAIEIEHEGVRLEPLRTLDEIRQHGLDQRNCVGRNRELVGDLIFGRAFLYAAHATSPEAGPVTATVSVVRGPDDDLALGDIKAAQNKPAPAWLVGAVEQVLPRLPEDALDEQYH